MKWFSRIQEPALAAAALMFTLALLATRNMSMSDMGLMTMLGLFTVALLGYSAFVFRENPADEREHELSLVASKYAYLVGSVVLCVGIVVQTLDHTLDPWLPVVLASMVIAKSLAYFIRK